VKREVEATRGAGGDVGAARGADGAPRSFVAWAGVSVPVPRVALAGAPR
jgi:hypothetical protein